MHYECMQNLQQPPWHGNTSQTWLPLEIESLLSNISRDGKRPLFPFVQRAVAPTYSYVFDFVSWLLLIVQSQSSHRCHRCHTLPFPGHFCMHWDCRKIVVFLSRTCTTNENQMQMTTTLHIVIVIEVSEFSISFFFSCNTSQDMCKQNMNNHGSQDN